MRGGFGNVPPIFINQLVHVILRNALDGTEDARVLRAAELSSARSVSPCTRDR